MSSMAANTTGARNAMHMQNINSKNYGKREYTEGLKVLNSLNVGMRLEGIQKDKDD